MTIINRRTFLAQQGKFREAIALLCTATKGSPYKYRIASRLYDPVV